MNYETMDLHFIWCSVSITLETFNLFCYWNSRNPRMKAQCLLVALCGLWKRRVRCRYTGPWICGRHGDHPPCNCPTEEGPTFVSSVACPLQRPNPDRGSLVSPAFCSLRPRTCPAAPEIRGPGFRDRSEQAWPWVASGRTGSHVHPALFPSSAPGCWQPHRWHVSGARAAVAWAGGGWGAGGMEWGGSAGGPRLSWAPADFLTCRSDVPHTIS